MITCAQRKKKHTLSEIYSKEFKRYTRSPSRKLRLEKRHYDAVYKTMSCGTDRLGYAYYVCECCNESKRIFRSCGSRFCGRCGSSSTQKWAEESLSLLLDMKHHHVIMTLPKPLRFLSKLNDNKIHDLLFQNSTGVLQSWFRHKRNLRPGIVSVLHTSGSDLKYHPHVHMIVSGGGADLDTGELKELPTDYLTKQRFLGNQLRIRMERSLLALYKKGELRVPIRWQEDEKAFNKWLKDLGLKHWIVSIQKSLDNREQIVGYVGRYTKRACLSEYKIEKYGEGEVSFRYNDYKNTPRGSKPKETIKTMKVDVFLDELLQHVPTKRYRMVRYSGLYCSHYKKQLPKREKEVSEKEEETEKTELEVWGEFEALRKEDIRRGKEDPLRCKHCKVLMEFKGIIYPPRVYINDS